MPAADTWTIDYEDGGPDGAKLNDCQISQTATQTQLLASDGTILGTSSSVTPDITFDSFSVPGSDIKFTLTITSFTSGPNSDEAAGTWATVDTLEDDPQNGDWTAQAGVGVEPKAESMGLPMWTLIHEPGDPNGAILHGCHIVESASGEYKFRNPEDTMTLSESLIAPPIFEDFEYQELKWTITADSQLIAGEDAQGRWRNVEQPGNAQDANGEDGTWTAQAGVGPIGERAASADAS